MVAAEASPLTLISSHHPTSAAGWSTSKVQADVPYVCIYIYIIYIYIYICDVCSDAREHRLVAANRERRQRAREKDKEGREGRRKRGRGQTR